MGVPGVAPFYPGLPSPPDNPYEVMTSSPPSSDERFAAAFRHNFYFSDEWAGIFHAATQYPVRTVAVGGAPRCVVKDKLVGISNFSDEEAAALRRSKIEFLRVLPVVNNEATTPSLFEYAIWFTKSYDEALRGYQDSFRRAVRQAERHDIRIIVHREYEADLIGRIYPLYERQMNRLNSFVFPRSFFASFLQMPSAFCITIEHDSTLIGYCFCAENADNLYPSVGGIEPAFFPLRAVNRMYDYLVRYACERSLNIHFGLGLHDSGFDKFKQHAGASIYKVERHPDHPLLMRLFVEASRLKWYGRILRRLSLWNPARMAYEVMPTT
jgi:hypothetical protein